MAFILITLLVLNDDTFNDFNDIQLKNISCISITLLVLNEDKSIDFNDVQL